MHNSKKENGGGRSARPFGDMFGMVPRGAILVASAGSRTAQRTRFELVYSLEGATYSVTFNMEGDAS